MSPVRVVQVERDAFHLIDRDELPEENTLKLEKTATWAEAMERIAEVSGVPAAKQLYWHWGYRENGTYRPLEVLDPHVRGPHFMPALSNPPLHDL